MRLTEIQTQMLTMLWSMPKLSREFVRKFRHDYAVEDINAAAAGLVTHGLVDVDRYDMHSISDAGMAWLTAPRETAGIRMITNASSRGLLQAIVMTPVRPDPSRLIKSLSWSPDRKRQSANDSMPTPEPAVSNRFLIRA